MTAEKAQHRCRLPHCDGTRLGHDLAAEFPEETKRIDDAFDRLRTPREDRVMPENLQVDPPTETARTDQVSVMLAIQAEYDRATREDDEFRDENWRPDSHEWLGMDR